MLDYSLPSRWLRWPYAVVGAFTALVAFLGSAPAQAAPPPFVTPDSVRAVSGGPGAGGTIRSWHLKNGMILEQRLPPAHFDFARASKAERDYYGIPASVPAAELANLHVGEIGGLQPTGITNANAGGQWAGEIAQTQLAIASAATFVEPTLSNAQLQACAGYPESSSYWTGIGGVGNDLIQNGTSQGTDANGTLTDDGDLWAEAVGATAASSWGGNLTTSAGNPIPVPQGHTIAVETQWDQKDSNSSYQAFYFSWSDENTGQYWSVYGWAPKSDPSWANWDTETSEFVVEHPVVSVNSQTIQTNMLDFGTLNSALNETELNGVNGGTWLLNNNSTFNPYFFNTYFASTSLDQSGTAFHSNPTPGSC